MNMNKEKFLLGKKKLKIQVLKNSNFLY